MDAITCCMLIWELGSYNFVARARWQLGSEGNQENHPTTIGRAVQSRGARMVLGEEMPLEACRSIMNHQGRKYCGHEK